MKKYFVLLLTTVLAGILASGLAFAQLDFIDPTDPNITQDLDSVLETTDIDGNPLRQGTYLPVESPDGTEQIGVINQGEIQSYGQGQLQTLDLVKNIINYFLGFLGAIALIILIYAGFKVVIAGTDDQKYKEAIKTFRKVAIAIGGIALSRFIVTFLFFVVSIIVDGF